DLHTKIVRNIDELKGLFAEDVLTATGKSLKGFRSLDEKLSWILFIDGCSLLYFLAAVNADNPEDILNIKLDQLSLVTADVLLLENQLPYLVLKLLWENDNETELKESMENFVKFNHWGTAENETKSKDNTKNFLKCHNWATPDIKRIWGSVRSRIQGCFDQEEEQQHSVVISIPNSPTHLLDLQLKIILIESSSKTKGNKADNINQGHKSSEKNTRKNTRMMTYRNIQDLRKVGINLESSAAQGPIDIDFFEGWFAAKLILPEIVVDDTTASTFLNLIAYEMCPDFDTDYEISSFVSFMDSLIDHVEDVRILRSKGILLNCLGSDEEVAHLFNIISTDLMENIDTYPIVRDQIHEHYCNKYKTWIALGIHTYFDNPWTVIAFIAAFIALILTVVQTCFTIKQSK
ncbi:DUF247 domain protein, partial [Trifolium medium]|nr:DUF247 domain protein [Trifolium medium]